MPRRSLNLKNSNIEQMELTSEQVKGWLDVAINYDNQVQCKLEIALDEAYQEIAEGSSNTEYVIIKILK